MLTRRVLLLCAASFAVTANAKAENAKPDDGSALAFVKAIYAPYKGKNTKGITLDTDAQLRRYFEPSLVALISRDRKEAARSHDVPALDGDPFIDAQDWEIQSFDISVNDTGDGKATSVVKFVNAGDPATITLDLVSTANAAATGNSANASKASNAWRIHDITYQHDGKPETLRGLFAH